MKHLIERLIILATLVILGATAAMACDRQEHTGWYFWSYLPSAVNARSGELYPDLYSCAAAMWTFASLVNPVTKNHTETQTIRNLGFMTCMPESRYSTADASTLPNVTMTVGGNKVPAGSFIIDEQRAFVTFQAADPKLRP